VFSGVGRRITKRDLVTFELHGRQLALEDAMHTHRTGHIKTSDVRR
jgi:hypothetical protein